MTELPRVFVTRRDGGWAGTCDRCGWQFWKPGRPAVDEAAIEHRTSHQRREHAS